jgi:hypothetical protein
MLDKMAYMNGAGDRTPAYPNLFTLKGFLGISFKIK